MRLSRVAVALCAAACGDVATAPADSGVAGVYRGHIEMTPPFTFGGLPFCNYSITLEQLDVELTLDASGSVRAGKVQDLNVETVLATVPPCPAGPIPPNIATYTLASAMPAGAGTLLTFLAGPTNEPEVDLTATLTTIGGMKTAKLSFQRINVADDVLAWMVAATATLTAQ